MKQNVVLAVSSLLSIVLVMVHLADDYSRGFSPGGMSNLPVAPVLAVWAFAALVLGERRSGLVVLLVMSILAAGLPVIHMTGRSGLTGGATPKTAGALFFAWTLLMLGANGILSVMLSVRGLLHLRRAKSGVPRS